MTDDMRAWATGEKPGQFELVTRRRPVPRTDEVLISVEACGICRTDLHVIDRDIPVHRPAVIPGHEVVGRVVELGAGVTALQEGDRVGVAWLRSTCGECEWCLRGAENLCPRSTYTGWDEDGGYAEYTTVSARYAYRLPGRVDPVHTAPLLCAGIIGFRALMRAQLPPGGVLGIYGFGSSGHLTAELAMAGGARVFAMTRGAQNRRLAAELHVDFIGAETAQPPEPLDSAVVFAPAGTLVPVALAATKPGGTVVLAGIHMTDVPALDYGSTLFHERDLRTVTSNTRSDGIHFLRLAQNLALQPAVRVTGFEALGESLAALRAGRLSGSTVMRVHG